MLRTHTCGELTSKNDGSNVTLSGWVNKTRNLGGMLFVDLRDRYGITQIVFDPANKDLFSQAENIKSEYVIKVDGKVSLRPSDQTNKDMTTGEIEIHPLSLEILSKSDVLPFPIVDNPNTSEENRFKYRFLDLRRRPVLKNIEFRTKMLSFTREWFSKRGFFDIQTPIFTVSSPEGARDYLIPSRVNPGKFYALPQAPQQYKQLLMVGGIDKYFQIAPCFRDEDPRADRHSCEFYQVDCEMSFVDQEDIYTTVEGFMRDITRDLVPHKKITTDFVRMKYVDAIDKYGTDKPDLRFGMEFVDLTNIFKDSGFSVFKDVSNSNKGTIKAINLKNKNLSRKEIDELTKVAQEAKAKGLAYISYTDEGPQSSIVKFFNEQELSNIKDIMNAEIGDTVLIIADQYDTATKALNKVRLAIRDKYNLVNKDDLCFVWIEDFPMFEKNEETGKLDFAHNPFSFIKGGVEAFDTLDPMELETTQYDLIINGYESLSGSIRNHSPEILLRVFEAVGMGEKEIKDKFGAMYDAFKYGPPPHGGFAIGFDRFMMILLDEENIRECYAFPKSGRAEDVMMGAPGTIDLEQLNELFIKVDLPKDK
ncbi:aspartate--tRNA ligase [Candidatus Gracilibacteria bacterium]|nr:aspartate--tRNA ligase [Candidatus Gracilibacteria bacterium]